MKRVAVVLVMLCAVHSWAAAAELFVATNGADDALGTLQAPLATLVGARDAIRAMKAADVLPAGGVTVWIRGGVYPQAASFTLGTEDSGTADAPIVYRAYQDEEVRISGGRGVDPSHLKPVTDPAVLARLDESARGQVLALDMSAEGITDYLPELPDAFMGFTREYPALLELFCNGDRMQVARSRLSLSHHF